MHTCKVLRVEIKMTEFLNILNICKCLLKTSGLTAQSSVLHRILFSVFFFTLFFGAVNLLSMDVLDKKQLIESIFGIPIFALATTLYWIFIYRCPVIEEVINELTNVVNERNEIFYCCARHFILVQ